MQKTDKILITGSTGLIGSELVKLLHNQGFINLLTPASKELDLKNQQQVNNYFSTHRPTYVFHLAAKVGGIYANSTFPGDFIYENTMMHSNVFIAAKDFSVRKVLFPGSACSYPKSAQQPIIENAFYDGAVEPTNIAYATAKINGVVMAQSFASQYKMNFVIPFLTNTYGILDCFDGKNSHVIPALLKKFYEAHINKEEHVILWGSGKPLREFIYAEDAANALLFLMNHYNSTNIINVGTEQEISIKDLALEIKDIVGFNGEILFDSSKPDGVTRKCLDSSKIKTLGWKPHTTIRQGIQKIYANRFTTTHATNA